MNSRERVLASLQHREPDQVPVDLGSTPSSGISAIAYERLCRHLGKDHQKTLIYDVIQQLAQPDEEILDLFGIDVLDVGRVYNVQADDWHSIRMPNGREGFYPIWFTPEQNEDGPSTAYHRDGTPIAKMPVGATFFDQTFFPWQNGYPDGMKGLDNARSKVLWSAFGHSPWNNMHRTDFWEDFRKRLINLRKNSDRALAIGAGCNLFEWGSFIRRMDNFMMDLYLEPDNVESFLDALMERHLNFLSKLIDEVGDLVDIVRFGDDLGSMGGPLMDPDLYRKYFKPRHKELCEMVKSNSSMHTYLHSCGSIYQLIPDLIEAGFEILNPVQTQARDMEPEKLKREFGRDVTFWGGGIETVGTLNNASPEKVRTEVLSRLEIFSKGGGFIFNTIHNILPDVPPENILAMYEAVKEFNS